MKQEFITITSQTGDNQNIAVDYSDDDIIIIIDNIKDLEVKPSSAQLKMNLIAVCTQGRTHAQLSGSAIEIGKNQLLLCPPGAILSDFLISPDFEFKAVFLTNSLIQSFLREKINVWHEVMYIHRMHVVTMDEQDISYFALFYEMLRLCIDNKQENPYHTDVIQSLLRSAFLGLCGELRRMLPDPPAEARQGDGYFQRFLDLLNHSHDKQRTVEDFASRLCISPKYLSAICKKNSGKTANEWIRERMLEEIRYYLRQTDLSMKQIADQLGFANPSFFGKYVKEHFGMTPTQFRRRGS